MDLICILTELNEERKKKDNLRSLNTALKIKNLLFLGVIMVLWLNFFYLYSSEVHTGIFRDEKIRCLGFTLK